MKKFTLILSVLIMLTLAALSMSSPAFAHAEIPLFPATISAETYHIENDPSELFKMAVEAASKQSKNLSQEVSSVSVTQTLKERVYQDGTTEKDLRKTVFCLNEAVSLEELQENITEFDDERGFSGGEYSVYYTCTAEYTVRMESLFLPMSCRLNRVRATVTNTSLGTGDEAATCAIYGKVSNAVNEQNFSCGMTTNPQNFSVSSPSSEFMVINSEMYPFSSPIQFGITIETVNGGTISDGWGITDDDLYG